MKRGLGGDGGIERLRLEMGYGGIPRQGEALQLVGVGTKKIPPMEIGGIGFYRVGVRITSRPSPS